MFASTQPIVLTEEERAELEGRLRSQTLRVSDARSARVILMLADGCSNAAIRERLGCNRDYVARWKGRFLEGGLAALYPRHQGSRRDTDSVRLEARILKATMKPPTDGTTHWSARRLAKHLGVTHMRVARAWERAGLSPWRVESYVASNDPDFETKALDVIGLYINPPEHAIVFSVDEKTAIQALDRTLPVLPFSPGRAERHGFEYIRKGTLSLYAALETATGKVTGKTVAHHTSEEFVAFIASLVAEQPADREIHIIADNLSAHKTKRVADFLAHHANVELHFTPTYSSWLNQVELWFSKLERQVTAQGIFTSVHDLADKLMSYIRKHNIDARPIKWKYTNPKRRIRIPDSSVTVH